MLVFLLEITLLCKSSFLENHVSPNPMQLRVCTSACDSYIRVCVQHVCMKFKERGIEESEKQSERLETGWGMDLITGLEWLEGLVVLHFLNRTFLSASWGRIHNYRQACVRGSEC